MKNWTPALFVFLLAGWMLTACMGGVQPPAVATATPASPATLAPAPSATILSSSPTPVPAKLLLISPPGVNAAVAEAARALLVEQAAQAKLVLDVRPAVQPAELNAEVKVLVFLAQPANLTELLAAAPAAQFVVLASSELQAKGHLSVISANPHHLAFVAGYTSALISPDWRAAALLADQPASLLEAFQNGGRYWCGRCAPRFAPVVFFPVGVGLPPASGLPAWQDAYEKLKKNVVETIYVQAEVATPELLAYLAGQKVTMLGGQTPAEAAKSRWAVTLRQDALAALKTLLPDLAAGKGGKMVNAAITFGDVNETLFTPGKQRLVLDVIRGLGDGTIAPLSVKP